MRLDHAVSTFLTAKQEVLAESTHKQYRNTLHDFASVVGYSRPIAEITSAEIEKWRDHHSKQKKPQSVNAYMNRVRALFEYAIKRGWVETNPVMLVDSLRVESPERKRYSANTLGRALDAARNPRDRAAIAVALELLLRGNEITRMKIRDLDLDNRIVKVKVSKKNGPDSWDEMAITEELAHELRQWLGTYAAIAGELDPNWYLFPRIHQSLAGPQGEHQLRVLPEQGMGSPWRVVKRALLVVGVDEKGLGFHTIRRSAARILFDHMSDQQGDSRALSHVSSLLHHENRRTTEQYLGSEGDRRNRNLAVRQGTPSALTLTLAELDELADVPSSGVVVDLDGWRSA